MDKGGGRGCERKERKKGKGGGGGEVKLQNRQCNISNVINPIESVIIGNSQTYFCHFSITYSSIANGYCNVNNNNNNTLFQTIVHMDNKNK